MRRGCHSARHCTPPTASRSSEARCGVLRGTPPDGINVTTCLDVSKAQLGGFVEQQQDAGLQKGEATQAVLVRDEPEGGCGLLVLVRQAGSWAAGGCRPLGRGTACVAATCCRQGRL